MASESALAATEKKWDEADVAQVRSVAWLEVDQVVSSIWDGFSDGAGSLVLVQRCLAEAGFKSGELVGAALLCGDMQSERAYFEHVPLAFSRVDGFDISSQSLARYQPDGLAFVGRVVDCNHLDLEPQTYHLIVACHAVHHVENLSNVFYQASRGLKPGGVLFMYEWIGPRYLQIPRRNHVVAAALLWCLFPRRRTRTTHLGMVKGRTMQEPADSFEPSEACNSPELYPQFKRYFEVVHAHEHGALTYPMFEGIAQNLNLRRPSTRRRISIIIGVERLLTRLRVVKPLFVVAIGRSRSDVAA